jgi:amino acid adenylation domain-containing protein
VELLLRDGRVRLAVTQPRWAREIEWPQGVEPVVVDDAPGSQTAPPRPTDAAALAYVIYTSGSSGQPKGVAIEHRAAVNTLLDINRRFGVGAKDVVFALSALGFDLSVYDFFGTLAAGARIALPEPAASRDPSRWARFVLEQGATVWNSVPALAHLYAEYVEAHPELRPSTLRLFLLSGDWIPVDLPDRLRALAPAAQVVSLGGATEASVWSILFPVERVDPAWESIPYGRPMTNQSFHVLDDELAPRPEHVPGGLFIGGAGLAREYWADPEKTADRFLRHPQSGERLYRTGDLGRFLPSGVIEFLGRDDLQVKVQGHRIELLEVEAALARHPELRAAAAGSVGPRSLRRLVAWIVPATPPGPDDEAMRAYLAARLPEAMIPSAFVRLDRLPLTANGKVDHAALPEPHAAASPAARAAGSGGPADRIAALAARILPVPGLSVDSNLLDLGATSVDLIRLANLLESELGRRPSIDVLYRAPVVRDIARLFGDAAPAARAATEPTPRPEGQTALLLDPDAREAWKRRRPGLREPVATALRRPLAPLDGLVPPRPDAERRSRRRFSLRPVPFAALSALLSRLAEETRDGEARRQYASAGALYAVQAYLWAKPGRLEGLDAGSYYFHPVERALVLLRRDADIDRDLYGPFVNRPIFDEAAFALFLVADMAAIEPLYGERSLHYATIEAGAICQLLETAGAAWDVGLCQIGQLDLEPVRDELQLGPRHALVHSLLGGRVDPGPSEAGVEPAAGRERLADQAAARRARLLEQVRGLPPAELQALLEAERRRGGRG